MDGNSRRIKKTMKKYITQKDFSVLGWLLMEKLREHQHTFDFVLGIKNGGLNVSTPIATEFKKPHHSIRISFYDGEQRLTKPLVDDFEKLKFVKTAGKFLWVDDIIDSGSTLRWFIENTGLKMSEDFQIATIHWCKENSPDLQPNFYVDLKDKNDWIVYPWEM